MSFRDTPIIPQKAKAGCLLYGVIGAAISLIFFFGAAMGHCVPNAAGAGCENERIFKLAMFPGSLILFLLGGVGLLRHLTKENG